LRRHALVLIVAALSVAHSLWVGSPAAQRSIDVARCHSPARMLAKKKKAAGGAAKTVQVVLTAEIKGVGRKGELVSVKPAYADNFIVNKGLGAIATPEKLAEIAAAQEAADAEAAALKAQAMKDAETIAAAFGEDGGEIAKNVGPDGAVFGSVTAAEVIALIKERANVSVQKKQVKVPEIKTLGSGLAEVALHKEVTSKVKIVVVAS